MTMINNKQIKREKLLDQEGVHMLMKQGCHGTGMQDILDSVQVPKGSFYNYFASKEEFADEAITHYIEPFILRLTAHLQAPPISHHQLNLDFNFISDQAFKLNQQSG